MLLAVLSGFIAALFAPLIHRITSSGAGALLALVPAAIFAYLLTLVNGVVEGGALNSIYEWVPALGVNLQFYVDGLSLFFGLLISGFGAFIIFYAGTYLKGDPLLGRFLMFMLLFMGSMMGVVFSGNLVSLFVFWELTSVSSFLLISFKHKQEESRKSALQAMFVTVSGGLAMFGGFVLIATITGTYDIATILSNGDLLRAHPLYTGAAVLILLGAFTKSAQFPFHFWLPNAMAAPTPVSAYLHSATMVKAGIYLVARFTPALGNTPGWNTTLIIIGTVTMLMGAIRAIMHTDLKKILAYTTISALGLIMMLLGIGTALAIQAAVIFIMAHALYKGTLFLITGNLDHETGTRDVNHLSGLREHMPLTAIATILAGFSMAGVMPFFGFVGKEVIYEAALGSAAYNIILLAAVIVAGVLFAAIALELGWSIYFGARSATPKVPHEAPLPMLAGPIAFSGMGLLLGIFGAQLVEPLLNTAANSILPPVAEQEGFHLALWHGFNVVFVLSLITVAAGFGVYQSRNWIRRLAAPLDRIRVFRITGLFNSIIKGVSTLAYQHTKTVQSGYLRNYIAIIILFWSVVMYWVLWQEGSPFEIVSHAASTGFYQVFEFAVVIMMGIAIVQIFLTRSRLTAIAAMGVVGYGVALVFIFFGAPDVAITQFLIETLSVVLFVLVINKLPPFKIFSKRRRRLKYFIISLFFGSLMTYIMLSVISMPLDSALKEYFGAYSYPLGKGRNIVNVILVDFRAFDTLGESMVLGIVAIGVFSLLRLRTKKEDIEKNQ
jgi:multicomponent Na+:H+ antiporter subunit A